MHVPPPSELDAKGLRLALAVSRYHEDVTGPMATVARETFLAAGGRAEDIQVVPVAGAFELTIICQALARREDVDGVIAIGCVIRGETTHDEHICRSLTHGLTEISLATGKPIAFGVLTCQTKHQARVRAQGDADSKGKGHEAMAALIETLGTLRRLQEQR
jgi:6,7-dimethyl-8-ribityllumazine synthase